jgi:putative membrane protein
MQSLISHFLRGFVMGAADIVPGVSGGTVALVLGIYRRLVRSIRNGAGALAALLRFDTDGFGERWRSVEWAFVAPLLLGVAAAVLTLSHLIERLLEEEPIRMAALFFGLVAGSIVVAWRLVGDRSLPRLGVLAAIALLTFWLLGFSAGTVADPAWWAFFLAGAIAICAMILPGISGSFILLMMGMYLPVLGAVNDRRLLIVGVFLVGVVIGLASFSTLLNLLLERYHDTVMAALVGLMAGSLRVLWPWPDGTGGTRLAAPSGDVIVPVVLAVAGAAVVLVVTRREGAIAEGVEEAGEAAEAPS